MSVIIGWFIGNALCGIIGSLLVLVGYLLMSICYCVALSVKVLWKIVKFIFTILWRAIKWTYNKYRECQERKRGYAVYVD